MDMGLPVFAILSEMEKTWHNQNNFPDWIILSIRQIRQIAQQISLPPKLLQVCK